MTFLTLLLVVRNSERVPHSLQEGHCPFHLGKSSPQEEHRKAIFDLILAMMGLEIAHQGKRNQERFTSLDLEKNTIGA